MINRKLLDHFISLIEAVECFDILLKNSNGGSDKYHGEVDEIVRAEKWLNNDFNSSLVVDEIENNLYTISGLENQLVFVKSLLRRFARIFPYYNFKRFFSEPTKKHLFAVDQIDRMSTINAFMLKLVDHMFSNKTASFSILESYLIESFIALEMFARAFTAMLLNFGIDLEELENELGVFISIGERDTEYFEGLGFGKNKNFNVILNKVTTNNTEIATIDKPEYIIPELLLKALRLKFEGYLWPVESEQNFLNHWITGENATPLAIFPDKKYQFCYLYFTYINRNLEPDSQRPQFLIKDQISEQIFGLRNIKMLRKRCKTLSKELKDKIDKDFNSIIIYGLK